MAHELEINPLSGKYEMAYTQEMPLTYQPLINGKLRGNTITNLGLPACRVGEPPLSGGQ